MNRRDRRQFLGSIDKLVDEILGNARDWKSRRERFGACLRDFQQLGRQRGGTAEEINKEIGAPIAARLIAKLGSPPIGDIDQALLYGISADPAHRFASEQWQARHPGELKALQRQFPEIGPLGGEERVEKDYLLNLRQALLILVKGPRSSPADALRALLRTLLGQYRAGAVVARAGQQLKIPDNPDWALAEIGAVFFEGKLKPLDAAAEIALQDAIDQANRDAREALQVFYGLVGRRPGSPLESA